MHLSHARTAGSFVTLAVQSVDVRASSSARCASASRSTSPAGPRTAATLRAADALRAALGRPRAQRRGAVRGGARVRGARRAAAQRLTRPGDACTRSPTPLPCCAGTGGCWRASASRHAVVPRTVVLLGLDQPVHRHLLGDGRRPSCRCTSSTSAASRRWRSASSTASTTAPPRWSAWPAASSATAAGATRRSRRPATASRPCASSCSPPSAPRCRRSARSCCIDRIGKGIRTAPRDAMISLSTPERAARRRLRRAPRAGHDRRDDRPAARLRPARARAAGLRLDLPRQLLHRARSASASSSLFVQPKQARDAADAPSQRRAPSLRGALGAAAPSRATARCCSPAAR